MAKIVELLPGVLHTLRASDKIDMYITFTELIANKKLPMSNIAFLLFTDVVEWFSTENTHQMRYSDIIQHFWHVGLTLFKGKCLRCIMSGWKNQGQDPKGLTRPEDSIINIAVPDRRCHHLCCRVLFSHMSSNGRAVERLLFSVYGVAMVIQLCMLA
jgi:hypothetical protein